MPSLETPPSSTQPDSPGTPEASSAPLKVRTGRYGELEEHELIHLLDSLDDERAKARFRESIYISIIFYLIVGWFVFYGPQVLFHQPRLINPSDVLKQRELTYLNMPKDVAKDLPRKPTKVISDKDRVQQTAKPTLDKKTLEQLQAMRRAGAPAPTVAPPTPQPPQQQPAPPQQAQQQPQQPLPPSPTPQKVLPPQQAMVDAPRPAPTRPNFGNQNQSGGDGIRQGAAGTSARTFRWRTRG